MAYRCAGNGVTLIQYIRIFRTEHQIVAHRTCVWSSEAKAKAAVHCIIIGFAGSSREVKCIFNGNQRTNMQNINPYLLDSDNIIVYAQRKPFINVPPEVYGNKPADGGNLIIEKEDYDEFLQKEPQVSKYIRRYVGAVEFLHNDSRYCLWLKGANPKDIKAMPLVMERVAKCQEVRNNSVAAAIRKFAATPILFTKKHSQMVNRISLSLHTALLQADISPWVLSVLRLLPAMRSLLSLTQPSII